MKTLFFFIALTALAYSFPMPFFLILAVILLLILMIFAIAYLTSKAEDKAIAKEREKQALMKAHKSQQEREEIARRSAYAAGAFRLERERQKKRQQKNDEHLLQLWNNMRKYEELAKEAALKGDSDTARCWRYAAQEEKEKFLEFKRQNYK